jgi:hypothetical protein
MGLLDEAIREHLELKRMRGADPSEVLRQEREALGEENEVAEQVRPGSATVVSPAQISIREDQRDPIETPELIGHERHAQEATGRDENAVAAEPIDAAAPEIPGTAYGKAEPAQQRSSTPDALVEASAQPATPRAQPEGSEPSAPAGTHTGATSDFETAEVDMGALLAAHDQGAGEHSDPFSASGAAQQPSEPFDVGPVDEGGDSGLIDERIAERERRLKSFERGARGRSEKRPRRPWRS